MSKIISQRETIKIRENLKRQGKVVVSLNGSFDLLHTGHIKSIEEAKKQGDVLIIALNSDKSVRSYKGLNRPIIPEKDRALHLAALACVDYVVLFNETNSIRILDKIKPDIHCNGADWGRDCVELEVVEKNGGKIHILKWTQGWASRQLIRRIIDLNKIPTAKAIFIDRNGVINYNTAYAYKIDDFKFTPGSLNALSKLAKTDYKIIILTNQSGIARGLYTEEDFKKLNNWMIKQIKQAGARIDAVYYCPHHPTEAVVKRYLLDCPDRKPGTGMIEKARDKFNLSLNDSWLIGDTDRDIVAPRLMNIKSILTRTYGQASEYESKMGPQFRVKNLAAAIDLIVGK